jgi:hypothetical protein
VLYRYGTLLRAHVLPARGDSGLFDDDLTALAERPNWPVQQTPPLSPGP